MKAGPAVMDYLKSPAEIYARSFEIARSAPGLERLDEDTAALAVRLIHACGMPDIVADLAFAEGAVPRGQEALRAGAPVFCDCEMVRAGITRARLPAANELLCTLNDPRTHDLAQRNATTRSAAAVDLWDDRIDGAVVAIGNAPTALFRLLERLDEGMPPPALILGFPVGFVGALESKQELSARPRGVPFIALNGRRGGSALAAAAVNALCASAP